MREMDGRVAVVTGASTGIGRATAELLSERGARVVLFARRSAELERAQGEIAGSVAVAGDVRRSEDVSRLFEQVKTLYGGLDALFVNAGIAEFSTLEEADEEQYERLFQTNVKGAFLTMQAASPLLREGSSVVFTSSVAADAGAPLCSLYGATKGAVTAFARNIGAELLHRGIRVNVVAPGPTATPIQGKAQVSESGLARMAPYVMSRMRLGRYAQPREVAELVAFLLSPRSSFLVGQSIAADGGMTGL